MFESLIGEESSYDFFDPNTYELFLRKGDEISPKIAEELKQMDIRPSQVIEELVEWMAMSKEVKHEVKAWARIEEEGEGKFLVNGKQARGYFSDKKDLGKVLEPLEIADLEQEHYDIHVKVDGSSPEHRRHLRAIAFAIAGAIVCMKDNDSSLAEALDSQGYRDFCYHIVKKED